MSKFQTVEINGEQGRDYDHEYIMANPIPARCKKCKRTFTDGEIGVPQIVNGQIKIKTIMAKDAIRAPSLSGCRCFYCHGELSPLEKGGPVTVEQVEQQESMRKNQPRLQLY